MSDWQTRTALLNDLKTRVQAAVPGCGVFIGRLTEIPADRLPAIALYAPTDDMEPMGTSWQFSPTVSLAFEVLQSVDDKWCEAAETLTVAIITSLCASMEWHGIWKSPPSFATKQFVRDGGQPMVGEITTIAGELRAKRVSRLVAGPLEGVDLILERENESAD